MQPAGPDIQPPPLLQQAAAACSRAGSSSPPVCAGAVDAYVWGYPLVVMSDTRTRLACLVGVNRLLNGKHLSGPSSTAVVAPNNDTLYSTAFLDLRAAPVVLTVPAVSGRYVNFQLLDMYTNTFADLGVLTDGGKGGRYAIVGPGWKGTIPPGVRRIDAPTPDVWLLGRTAVNGPGDLADAVAVQRGYALSVLRRHGGGTTGGKSTLDCGAGAAAPDTSSISFFDQMSADMAADPALPQDGAVVRAMAAAGIAAGERPTSVRSRTASYRLALRIGAQLILEGTSDLGGTASGGWTSPALAGTFGTEYVARAVIAEFGLGEQVLSQAVYLSATADSSGQRLSGAHGYELVFAKGHLPPFGPDGFWSVTMYNSRNFLVANAIGRYSIGNRTPGLVYGPDGSLTIVMSSSRPKTPGANWLPCPAGTFRLSMRIYAPAAAASDGRWLPPPIERLA
ncbi:MAG TPA: DUF1254 domain-containing protein [Acidimicrobiales bacterium]|nr:DUF1254 domain-containing protein [Acidimicrobiales bacterium]